MAVASSLSLATATGFMVAAALVGSATAPIRSPRAASPPTARSSLPSPPPPPSSRAAAIEALPSVVFLRAAGSEEGGAECAFCLCELADGEAARVLPRCGHVFPWECVDMWLFFHTTFPLCLSSSRRLQVEMAIEIATDLQAAAEEAEDQVMGSSTAAAAAVAIRSLRRMLSRGSTEQGRRRTGAASPREGGGTEQGRPAAAKTPTSSR